MTFENTAWAIDGALLGSSLARRAEYAAVGGAQGVVQKNDLKVTELAVPGVGLLIDAGVGLINNDYQTTPNETYVVSNPSVHTIPAIEMPAASASARSFLVAIVVGDPDFSQTGHPWMGSDDPPVGEEQSFQYVRPTLIEVPAGTTELDVNYPALVLARVDIPANTTTITDSMIVDLRNLARPRQEQQIFVSPAGTYTNASPDYIPAGSQYANWSPPWIPTVRVPEWATRAIVVASINGVRFSDNTVNIAGGIRTQLGSVVGPATLFDYDADPTKGGQERDNLQTGGEYDVTAVAGTEVNLIVEGYQSKPASPSAQQRLRLQNGAQIIIDVRFFEE